MDKYTYKFKYGKKIENLITKFLVKEPNLEVLTQTEVRMFDDLLEGGNIETWNCNIG